MGKFLPGQRVKQSGIYRVHHDPHRLMHEASLRSGETFPCCKQCHQQVRFELIRTLRDEDVLPFSDGAILHECWGLSKGHAS
jgi:hypothetical protein